MRRKDRLILLVALVFLSAAAAVYYVLEHAQELNLQFEADRVLFAALVVVMWLLGLGLLSLLLRNLIKLLVERRRHILGSRFRTKLVFIFLVLVLIPSVVLFYTAVVLVQKVNERLLALPIQEIAEDSNATVVTYNRTMREDCARFGGRIATEVADDRLLDADRKAELAARAKSWLASDGLDFIALFRAGTTAPVFSLIAPSFRLRPGVSGRELLSPGDETVRRAIDAGQPIDDLARIGDAQKVSAVVPVLAGPSREIVGAVLVGRVIPPETAQRSERITSAYRKYKYQTSLKQLREFKRISIGLFALMTLLVLFAATWTGIYLARQITVPIQALVEGTQAISAGHLEHRVTARAADEIGFLIESFNRMTEELQSNREAIEVSRQKLEAYNAQLEERRQYIEQLLENVPAGVISLDAAGRVSTMNRAARRILGLSAGIGAGAGAQAAQDAQAGAVEAGSGNGAQAGQDGAGSGPGLPASEAFAGDDLLPLVHEIEDLPLGEAVSHVREFELQIGGRPVNLAANLSARRDAEGRFQGALIVIEDLTPVIRAQKTAAWREVARRIAHEIKNPLTPIQLSAQRILKKYHEGALDYPRIVEEGVSTIVGEVGTLKLLVDEFSRFARMPAVAPALTDPNSVVESALSLYDGIHPAVRFERDLDLAPPPALLDPGQMKRALVNLIDNAISAMEGQGTITLRTRSIPGERLLRIEVADDGPGISVEDKDRLFVPYFSTKKRGTGLGLAIVNRIVSDHNGFIRVEDNRPRGTKFVIDLPA